MADTKMYIGSFKYMEDGDIIQSTQYLSITFFFWFEES